MNVSFLCVDSDAFCLREDPVPRGGRGGESVKMLANRQGPERTGWKEDGLELCEALRKQKL